MSRSLRSVAVSLALALSWTTLGAVPARATSGTALPFTSFFRMVVDGPDGLEFVSGGPGSDTLAVFDTTGALVTTVDLLGPSGMALVGSKLFVAEADAPDIAVLDPSTNPPTVVRTIDVGSFTQPGDLTFLDGRLWFFTATGLAAVRKDGSGLSGPFRVNPSSYYSPMFVDGLTHETGLLTFERGGQSLYHYSATVPPVPLDSQWDAGGGGNDGQMAVYPGSASVLTASGSPYEYPEVRLTDGAILRAYGAAPYPTSVAATPTHGGLIAGGSDGIYNPDVWVYRYLHTPAFFTFDFGTTDQTVPAGGIAWSADGDALFVITANFGASPAFNVVIPTGMPTASSADLTVTPTADTVSLGGTVDVTVHLDGGSTNRAVKLYAQPVGGTRALIGSGTVDGAGDLTVAGYAPPSTTTFTATYAGDADWGAATTAVTVQMWSTTTARLTKSVGSKGHYLLYPAGEQIPLVARIAPSLANGGASIEVQSNTGSGWADETMLSLFGYGIDGRFTTWIGTFPSKPRYRVRVLSDRTAGYLASISAWLRFRFVG